MLGIYLIAVLCLLLGFALLIRRSAGDHTGRISFNALGIEIHVQQAAPGVVLCLCGVLVVLAVIAGGYLDSDAASPEGEPVLVCTEQDSRRLLDIRKLISRQTETTDHPPSDWHLAAEPINTIQSVSKQCLDGAANVFRVLVYLESPDRDRE